MTGDTDTEAGQRSRVGWGIALFLAAGLMLAFGYWRSARSLNDLAYLLGSLLPIGLAVATVFWATGRSRGSPHAAIVYLVLIGAMFGGAVMGHRQQRENAVRVATAMSEDLHRLNDSRTDEQGLPQRIQPVDENSTASGTVGELDRVMRAYMNDLFAQRNAYIDALNAIGWYKVLDPDRLARDTSFEESHDLIAKARDIVAGQHQKIFATVERLRTRVDSLNLDPIERANFMRGFDASIARSRRKVDAIWDIEKQTVEEFAAMIDVLERSRGRWQVADGQVLFERDADLEEYNAHGQKITDMTQRQRELQQQGLADADERLKALAK